MTPCHGTCGNSATFSGDRYPQPPGLSCGRSRLPPDDDKEVAKLPQEPPRTLRDEPGRARPSRSFHSLTLPVWPFQMAATLSFGKLPVPPAVPMPVVPEVTAVGAGLLKPLP
jgi:hypothetical protein